MCSQEKTWYTYKFGFICGLRDPLRSWGVQRKSAILMSFLINSHVLETFCVLVPVSGTKDSAGRADMITAFMEVARRPVENAHPRWAKGFHRQRGECYRFYGVQPPPQSAGREVGGET
jgi:hypothetical protein